MKALPPAEPQVFRRSHQQNQNGVQYQYPVCSICNRDVEAFAWSDHSSHTDGAACRTFFVGCHGETETVTLRMADMTSGQMTCFRIEKAFLPPMLEEVPPPVVKLNGKRIAGMLSAG